MPSPEIFIDNGTQEQGSSALSGDVFRGIFTVREDSPSSPFTDVLQRTLEIIKECVLEQGIVDKRARPFSTGVGIGYVSQFPLGPGDIITIGLKRVAVTNGGVVADVQFSLHELVEVGGLENLEVVFK